MKFIDFVRKAATAAHRALKQALAFVPTRLPIGRSEFEKWSADVLYTYGWPKNDSMIFALASMIMHVGPTGAYKAKRYFGLCLHAGAAKQVAHTLFREAKERSDAALKAEEEARKSAEATANQQVAAANVPLLPVQN